MYMGDINLVPVLKGGGSITVRYIYIIYHQIWDILFMLHFSFCKPKSTLFSQRIYPHHLSLFVWGCRQWSTLSPKGKKTSGIFVKTPVSPTQLWYLPFDRSNIFAYHINVKIDISLRSYWLYGYFHLKWLMCSWGAFVDWSLKTIREDVNYNFECACRYLF